jgi:hypothetical protein
LVSALTQYEHLSQTFVFARSYKYSGMLTIYLWSLGRHSHVVRAEHASTRITDGLPGRIKSATVINAIGRWKKLSQGRGRSMDGLRKVWHAWKRFGQFIGDLIGRLVLTVFYFTLFMPFGLGVRLFSDPLALRPNSRAKWLERKTNDLTLEDSRRLF